MDTTFTWVGRIVVYLLVLVVLAVIVAAVEAAFGIKFPSLLAAVVYKTVVLIWGAAVFKAGDYFLRNN